LVIQLEQIDIRNVERIARSEPLDFGAMMILDEALPPSHVAARSLMHLAAGTSPFWCVPFLILGEAKDRVLGGCGFKTAPIDGRVEIGYGVAVSERGKGIATAGISHLLQLAQSSGEVREVIAIILPDNIASAKVVSRLGFELTSQVLDEDGEVADQWIWKYVS
jgi:RimJ/RimL family protein N-acetyltransferase